MKAKKIIVSILNILIMLATLLTIFVGVVSILGVFEINLIKGEDFANFLGKITLSLVFPILIGYPPLLFKMGLKDEKMIAMLPLALLTAISIVLFVTSLVCMIKVLKEKSCKASSIVNMVFSILGIALIVTPIITLLNNKLIKNISVLFTVATLTICYIAICLISFVVSLITCITSKKIAIQPQAQPQTQTGYAEAMNAQPQTNLEQTQQFTQPAQQTTQTTSEPQLSSQQTAAQILFGQNTQTNQTVQPGQQTQTYNSEQTYNTAQTPFVSSVQPPTNPFETTTTQSNSISNPASAYSNTQATSSYTNPASAYTQTNSSYTNPASTYTQTTQTTQPFNTTSSSFQTTTTPNSFENTSTSESTSTQVNQTMPSTTPNPVNPTETTDGQN